MVDRQGASGTKHLHSATKGPSDGAALRTLVVDDDPGIRRTLALCLKGLGCATEEAASGREALRVVQDHPVDLAFCDLKLERGSGLDLVPRLVAERPQLEIVVITAYAAVDTAVEAMRRGAKDYLPKPFTPAQIRRHVGRVRERRAAELVASGLEEAAALIETASPRMQAALQLLERAATHGVPVLLRGERGTGHEVLARRLHALSSRRDRPFVEVSCAAVAEERLGVELSSAAGGTAFLDEVADLPIAVQATLLRLLRERQPERAGAPQRPADVRIVAAASRDLEAEVKAGRFREELLYSLNVVEVPIPPLRERKEDILSLAEALVRRLASQAGRDPPALSPAAEARLLAHTWPGNYRELRNAVERALIFTPGKVLGPGCFPDPAAPQDTGQPVLGGKFSTREIEREHVRRVMSWAGTLEEASRVLGVAVTTLWRKRRKWGR